MVSRALSARRGLGVGACGGGTDKESVLRTRRRAEPHVAELKVVCLLALEIPCPWFGEKLKVRTHVASRGENLFSE